MKSIQQIALELGVSRQTVYTAVKRAGLSIDSLTAEKQGNKRIFSDEAAETVKQAVRGSVKENADDCKELSSKIDSLTAENKKLQEELEQRREELAAAEARIEKQEMRIDVLLHLSAEQANTIRLIETREQAKLLGGSGSDEKKPGLLKRLAAKIGIQRS